MRLVVIGVGHVGLVTAGCLARWGHTVIGLDADHHRIETLQRGGIPFHEPGLPELIVEGRDAGRLSFTTDLAAALDGAAAAFVCVGTPSLPDGAADLRYVEAVASDVARHASNPLVLVEKSTVPAQTGHRLEGVIAREQRARGGGPPVVVASNPEFLREGTAVEDTLHPDRVVIGASDPAALEVLRQVYAPVVDAGVPLVETDVPTAELIKHASNAFLATKISFINAVSHLCDAVGADVEVIAEGMGLDPRIGPSFLRAGLGYGGSCFPKDVDAFIHLAEQTGYRFHLLEEVRRINDRQRQHVLEQLREELWHLTGKTVALLGAAYKPDTDDLRHAPAIWLAQRLLEEGAAVRVFDPVAGPGVDELVPKVTTTDDPLEACRDADAAVVCTEWAQVRTLDPHALREALRHPILIDARNVYPPDTMVEAGFIYRAIGRRAPR
jgi:UDPglucose 6-dehydrogenase